MSLIDSSSSNGSIGVGNYKGVMLCNRPFGNSVAAPKKASSGEKPQFHCGVVPNKPGLPQPIPMKEKMLRRPQKDSVLNKHKKWLSDLQRTKDHLEMQYLTEIKAKQDQQDKFQEREKRMRELSISMMKQSDSKALVSNDSSDPKSINEGFKNDTNMAESKGELSPSNDFKAQAKAPSPGKKSAGMKLPAWAMTEKAAEDSAENKELEEADDLIKFAEGLDFDKYIDDVEVQTTMERLKRRINELQKEVDGEAARENEAEDRKAKRELLEMMDATAVNIKGDDEGHADSEALEMAKQLLQDDEEMQAVHSAKSVATMLKAAKDKIGEVAVSAKQVLKGPGTPAVPQVYNEPKIVTHDETEGTRLEGKTAIRNLPYMHRNPAV